MTAGESLAPERATEERLRFRELAKVRILEHAGQDGQTTGMRTSVRIPHSYSLVYLRSGERRAGRASNPKIATTSPNAQTWQPCTPSRVAPSSQMVSRRRRLHA